ncbi:MULTISPECIES: actin-binding WH2 domain-containing protein [Calothrix]|uniref:Actin-binding WH2 domain-containing protein n=2 Tax=Calothrix TaxID=1186 RepID=A0ABR8A5M0_9CYAN|nr:MULTISPECIES: actin-binding WH2 domain-containing protein [Calothrix]MBD2194730.1 actin-binding WH2 domain-containing protein [Calothrix parietina FACHB-288]MBD2203219.1 actin-binding WH2 domain-containing protein [Calothrix sp. FACHB-168]MBD2216485.1 actin-binding WH2 domain-containing protein [Calothrix sp. FACHB-1219]MBD2225120.1 actin-binding WH2 domain-containing protein [Calothrix anomala FACHB-343]
MIERQSSGIKYFTVLIGLLRDRQNFLEEITQGIRLPNKIISLLVCSSLFLAIYGGIIGAYHSWMQALSSAVKLPALYLITLLICLPTLYFSNIIFGSKRTFGQHFALVLTAVSVTSVLLFSFAPITLFFLITTNNYQFLILLNVVIFSFTGFIGISSLYQATSVVLEQNDDESTKTRRKIIFSWLFLYAFVGSQLGWTLRPFFGTPGSIFQLFRDREGSFYLSVLQAIGYLLGIR